MKRIHIFLLGLALAFGLSLHAVQSTINVGSSANDGTGDTLRSAMQKVNSNFTELYGTIFNFNGNQFGASSSTNIYIKSGVTLTNAVIYGSTSGSVTVGSTGSLIGTGAANGLNVATPASELHVGSTATSSPRGIMSAQYNTGTNGARLHMRKARGTETSPTVVTTADDLGNLLWSGYDGSSFLEMASIRGIATGTIAANRVPTQLIFSTATDASPSVLTDRVWLNASGYLGIGMDTPAAMIHVKSAGQTAGGIVVDNTASASYSSVTLRDNRLNNSYIGQWGLYGTTVASPNTGNMFFYNTAGGGIGFYVGSGTPSADLRVLITASGNLGLGTSGPDKKLEINSATGANLRLTYNDSDGSAANYADFSMSSGGDLTIAPSGSDVSVTGRLASTATSSTLAAAATTLAITSNVLTVTGDAGANTLATITGGLSGQLLTLIFVDSLVTITDDATGNANTVNLSAAFTSTSNDTLTLVFNGTSWREVARSVN